MLFTVNPNDGLPIYRQLVRQVKHGVASGALVPGEKMTSQRDLATELVISHLTVKKAYEVLEAEGIIVTERGRGTFVAEHPPTDLHDEGLGNLRARARETADAGKLLGLSRADWLGILRDAWKGDD
jgi:GntR family transcriptional regulator